MTESGAQYDQIGSKYDEYARTATQKRAESYTVLQMVGPLAGKRVLDLACGFGFYTRLLKQHGAAQVLGVDISPEMVRLANRHEQDDPLGLTYQVGDAAALPPMGVFDLVTAIYLLNYATSQDQLLGMCRSAYDNLAAGGRFIAYTVNPAYTLSKPNGAQYGNYFLRMTPEADRYVCEGCLSPSRPPPSSASSGARKPMSGRSRRQASGHSPGTRQRCPPQTWCGMVKPIGRISVTIAWSSGWSARNNRSAPGRGWRARSIPAHPPE
jgi:ubiquinone/menaquinone biosynthesis C-methylase UbiE